MRGANCHQSCGPLVGFGETARPPQAAAAEGFHQGNSGQAAARRGLETLFTRWRLETKRWNAAGREERRLRHRADRVRAATGRYFAGESPTEAGARLARGESEQN